MRAITSHPSHALPVNPPLAESLPARVSQMHRRIMTAAGWVSATFLVSTALVHLIFRSSAAQVPGFELFDVDSEANLPTWYASTLLQICAFLAFVISFHDAPTQKTGWRGIAFLLLLMGMDEVAGLHNVPSRRLSELIGHCDGYLMNAWVIPATIVLVVLGLVYLPFIKRLPRWLTRSLISAAIAYLIGAIGFEVLGSRLEYDAGGLHYDGARYYSLFFELTAVLEEAFEHIGVLATLSCLLHHASLLKSRLLLDFTQPRLFGTPTSTPP